MREKVAERRARWIRFRKQDNSSSYENNSSSCCSSSHEKQNSIERQM